MSKPEWLETLRAQMVEPSDPWVLLEGQATVEAAVAGWWELAGVVIDDGHPWDGPSWSGLEIERMVLDELTGPSGHRGVLGLAKRPGETTKVAAFTAALDPDALLVVCPRPADAALAGALIRLAGLHGAAGVLFGREGVSPFERVAVEASAGELFRLPVRVSDGGQLLRCLKAAGVHLVGTDTDGAGDDALPTEGRRALVVGDPAGGLGCFWRAACDLRVSGRPEDLLPRLL
ncbi:TrmH family RNA methyltransferase [Luteolibacter marinus]|uniref:TrmH family RNA methyltransferase n=1 Tax=Luteolibacter marinus TaxID=2776705 RepID=UPI00186697D1